MSDLLEETKSDYLEIKKLEYFKKALPIIIIGTIIIISGMLIKGWLHNRNISSNQKVGDLFIQAIQSNDQKLLDDSLDLIINDNSTAFSDIARLVKIQEQMSSDNSELLLKTLQDIAKSSKNNITMAYARVIWMNIMIDKPTLSNAEEKDLEEYIAYFKNESIPFFGSVSIVNALHRIKKNDIEGARIVLNQLLSNENISRTVQDQANAILSNL